MSLYDNVSLFLVPTIRYLASFTLHGKYRAIRRRSGALRTCQRFHPSVSVCNHMYSLCVQRLAGRVPQPPAALCYERALLRRPRTRRRA